MKKKPYGKVKVSGGANMIGWECGKCGSVYSPFVTECPTCKNSNIKITYSPYSTPSIGDKIPPDWTVNNMSNLNKGNDYDNK